MRFKILGLHGFSRLSATRQLVDNTVDLFDGQLTVVTDFTEFGSTFALRELGLAQFSLSRIDPFALVANRPFGLLKPRHHGIHALLQFTDAFALCLDRLICDEQALILRFFFSSHVSQGCVDLPLSFTETIQRLGQFERFHLNGVSLFLPGIEFAPRFLQRVLRVAHHRFDFRQPRLFLLDAFFAILDETAKRLDFALTFEQAVFGGVWREQRNALPSNDITTRRDTASASRQYLATVKCRL